MKSRHTPADIAKAIGGDPKQVARSLRKFSESAAVLSSSTQRMIERYPKQWVAVYDGTIRARASTLQSVLSEIDKAGIPREDAIVRYIDDTQRTLIV